MEPGLFASSPFLPVIGWSVVLLVVHILLQGMTATRELGTAWNAGPRDEGLKPTARIAGRAERASANFRETYPAFVALALVLVLKGDASGWGLGGAWLWFGCRILYIPLYLAGIAYVRSLAWVGSLAGLALMFLAAVL
ncbi:putative MAPEG superfamily protein [Ochrobactrum daejeonense]|uniref:Putative MAPEG superfamily protein n=1 Tax=Brucella daejeonensis TaxID=659015 RepID=A0A7W9AU90_9HYPH|nr:MAPEG family protein [Brucella daejeonensis]MBB5700536.1 putative MAPEG superfamily protein [Brucella daejeonensis]